MRVGDNYKARAETPDASDVVEAGPAPRSEIFDWLWRELGFSVHDVSYAFHIADGGSAETWDQIRQKLASQRDDASGPG